MIDEHEGEYLCTFKDEHCEWMSLSDKCEAVVDYKTYKAKKGNKYEKISTVDDFGEWIQMPYVFDDK